MLLYYITDRSQFLGDEPSRRRQLLSKVAEAARCCVDFIQLREKDLSSRALEQLAAEAVRTIRQNAPVAEDPQPQTKLLINSRCDVALAVGAGGVHLRSDDISVSDVRSIAAAAHGANADLAAEFPGNAEETGPFSASSANSAVIKRLDYPLPKQNWIVAVSCHSEDEVRRSAAAQADFAVFAPVFEKREFPETTPTGLARLRHACDCQIPVLALGGITVQNAISCLAAGAAGIAGIRLFQQNNIADVVRQLRIGCA